MMNTPTQYKEHIHGKDHIINLKKLERKDKLFYILPWKKNCRTDHNLKKLRK